MTPAQRAAIAAKLNVDLSTQDEQRLIKLCILHRAAPDVRPDFPVALYGEIERRYPPDAIAQEDVMFSTLQIFAQEFDADLSALRAMLDELDTSADPETWIAQHQTWIQSVYDDAERMHWLAKTPEYLQKLIWHEGSATMLAQHAPALRILFAHPEAVNIWFGIPDVWSIMHTEVAVREIVAHEAVLSRVLDDSAGRDMLLQHMDTLIAIPGAFEKLLAHDEAVQAMSASGAAMAHITASAEAMQILIASPRLETFLRAAAAVNAFASKKTAMQALAGSDTALAFILKNRAQLLAFEAGVDKAIGDQIIATVAASDKFRKSTTRVNFYASNTSYGTNSATVYDMTSLYSYDPVIFQSGSGFDNRNVFHRSGGGFYITIDTVTGPDASVKTVSLSGVRVLRNGTQGRGEYADFDVYTVV